MFAVPKSDCVGSVGRDCAHIYPELSVFVNKHRPIHKANLS